MVRKVLLVLIIAAVSATGAFAQFSIGGGIITDTAGPAAPVIDFEYSFGKTSIMWGATFGFYQDTYSYSGSSTSYSGSFFGLYVGPSFNVATVGQWSVYIPLLLYLNMYGGDSRAEDWDVVIAPGIRAKYAFNKNWSIYTGFGVGFINYTKHNSNHSTLVIMSGADVVLGFMYKF